VEILIVDDNPLNLLLAEIHIKSWGINTHIAKSGRLALQMIRQRNYDLIFMDIQMPELDGCETTRLIRKQKSEHYQKVPIIALTSVDFQKEKAKISECGMTDYVMKPFNPDFLRDLINKYLIENIDQ